MTHPPGNQPTSSTQLGPGDKCDRYEIVRLIGVGGMGEVYEALHEFTKKPVALKVLKLGASAKPALIDKMRAEAMVMCRIKHDNLVEVYDAGILDSHLIWMAMELLSGESLRERLLRGAVPVAQALDWAVQIADGVAAAHAAQVIHRDLKPENVFLTQQGAVRVLDFGTAKFEGFNLEPTRAIDSMGTIPYMSPEHIGREGVDARTDIYALGLIVHEMLAGRHPFAGESGGFPSLDQMIMMQLTREPDDLTNSIGAAVWRTLEPALAKKKDQRYATMTAFGDALRSARMQFTGEAPAIDAFPSTTQPSAAGSNPSSQTAAPHSPAAPQSAAAPPRYDPNAQVTPPPLEASTTPPRTGGIGKGGLLTLALLAAIVGAGVVVFVARTTTIAGTPAADVEAPSDDSDRKKRKKRRAKGEDDDAATSSAKPTGSANTSGASSAATTGEAVDAGVASTTSTGTTLSPPAKRGTPGTGAGSGHGAPAKSAPANTPRPGPRPPSDDGEIF